MDSIVKQLRKKKKLSQKELAEEVGTSRQTINSIERGRYTPSLPMAYKLSAFFDISIEEMFDFSEIKKEINKIDEKPQM